MAPSISSIAKAMLLCFFISACGGNSGEDNDVSINAPPKFSSQARIQIEDDSRGQIYQATAIDPDADRLTFFLFGGDDVSTFEITSSGTLSLAEPANYEAPTDADKDNVYKVKLAVSNGRAVETIDLVVEVVDVPTPTEQLSEWSLLGSAPWSPRDSSGELVQNGRLWIIGGWVSSYEPALRDVWTSSNGVDWTRVVAEAPWSHSDLAMAVTFKGRAWLMGGYDLGRLPSASASNRVWSSMDGADWTYEGAAPWSARLGAGIVVFNDRIWVIGGVERYYDGKKDSLKNDVWYTEDGTTWKLASSSAPWSPRAYHNVVAYKGRIYLFGGGNYVPNFEQYNDVWSSADGVNWRRETSRAEWLPRIWAAAVVYNDRIWLLGGHGRRNNADPVTAFNLNDVWTSTDGTRWTQMLSSKIWGPRHEASAWVANDQIYIGGGYNGSFLNSEVWVLQKR